MGVVLESDSDDEEKKETKKIVEKEEEESEVRFAPLSLPYHFTLCFVNTSSLLLRGDTFEISYSSSDNFSLRFEPRWRQPRIHTLSLFLSLSIIQEEAESTDEEEEEEEEEDEQPKKKKQKKDKTKKKKKRDADSDSENSDVIDDLSGDEVDASLIIPGGRSTRSTRPVFTKQMYAAANLDDESEDEE